MNTPLKYRLAEPIKILVVTGDLDIGGTERHLVSILPRLDRKKFEISVHTLTHRGELAEEIETAGIPVRSPSLIPGWRERGRLGKVWFVFRSALSLYRRLRRERPDIVHLYLPAAYLVGAPCAIFADCRKMVMSRRSLNYYQEHRPVLAFFERRLHQKMSWFTANSKAIVHDLREEGVPEKKIELIYNGVKINGNSSDAQRLAVRTELEIGAGTIVVSNVANLIRYKGHEDLISAMRHVNETMSDWILLCIGEDRGLGESLKGHAERCGILDKVRFLGRRGDVSGLLAASDIGIIASREEGLSNSLLEGMAAGLPMIATAVGGNIEAIVNRESGFLIPPGQPEAIAGALLELMKQPDERKKIGCAARLRVQKKFSMDACVRSYEEFYFRVFEEAVRSFDASRLREEQ